MHQALAPHRTLTHSFFTILALGSIGLLLWKTDPSRSVDGGFFGMFVHVLFNLPYEVGVSFFWPLSSQRFGLFWSLPEIWAYLDQTFDFLFAAVFFYALHRLARRYEMQERLLIPAAAASLIAFVGMVAHDLTGPSQDRWLRPRRSRPTISHTIPFVAVAESMNHLLDESRANAVHARSREGANV